MMRINFETHDSKLVCIIVQYIEVLLAIDTSA